MNVQLPTVLAHALVQVAPPQSVVHQIVKAEPLPVLPFPMADPLPPETSEWTWTGRTLSTGRHFLGAIMNKSKIKAELRRSACEEMNCYGCDPNAFFIARYEYAKAPIGSLTGDDWRIFFLLVAEAL